MGSFAGLTRPEREHLSLYVIGSGFGESSVIVLPRSGASRAPVIVVDTCMDGDLHLTLELLEELELSRIDLLLVTHSDLDHVRGLSALLDELTIAEAWRFPAAADVRTLASKWLRELPTERRLKELAEAMLRLDELADANKCTEACADTRSWHPTERAPSVTCLAPSQHDQRRSRAALDGLVRMEARGPRLAEEVARFLDRRSRRVGAPPNVLSLAATIDWRTADLRLVLGGDVERGDGSEHSGWRGILATLDRRKQRDRLQHVHAVKVAHHGSRGALEPEVWDEHVRAQPTETWAVIAPFKHGGVTLPDAEVLRDLHERRVRLAMCDAVPAQAAVTAAGWSPDGSVKEVCAGPVISLAWNSTGVCSAARGTRAAVYAAKSSTKPGTRRSTGRVR
jgi:hypothetical protein